MSRSNAPGTGAGFCPRRYGEPWGLGAVSTAEWTGFPLAVVLDRTGVLPTATDVVFRGAAHGSVPGPAREIFFERGLSLPAGGDGDVLLRYAINGEALPIQHCFPVRVIVPGWYGVASVNWLSAIELTDHPFRRAREHICRLEIPHDGFSPRTPWAENAELEA